MPETNHELPYFPFARPPLDPPPEFSKFQQEARLAPVRLWNGERAWLVTRFDDVRELLADSRFSAIPSSPGFPNVSEGRSRLVHSETPSLIRMDDPDHARFRRMVTREFTINRITALRPIVEAEVEALIDKLLAGPNPGDFHSVFSLQLPAVVIAKMLGVPLSDNDFFAEQAAKKVDNSLPPEEVVEAGRKLRAYIVDLLHEKMRGPEQYDDIVGRLILDHMQPGHLSFEEAIPMIELLIIAGHETTANSLSLGLLSLLQHREAFAVLRADPNDDIVRRAVEEMLRFHSVVQLMCGRVAREDVPFAGKLIRKGEGILPMLNQADRDPGRFPNPDLFDILRPTMTPHVAFGFGVHQCLGQPLARLEMNAAFSRIAARLPTLELAVPVSEIPFKNEFSINHGVNALPVRW